MTFDQWLKDNYAPCAIKECEFCDSDLLSAWEAGREVALDQVRHALNAMSSGNAEDLYDLIGEVE